ncbi:MAG: carbohydrate ABC transporter permease [Candidatus Izemoplasmataceae bacterium]
MLEDQHNVKAWFYLAPALVLLTIFIFYPIVNAFFLSFVKDYNYLLGTHDGFTFIGNFRNAMADNNFGQAFLNTGIITFGAVPLSVIISLLISAWLNGIKRLQGFFQTVFFLPYVTNAIAVGMAFAFLFNRDYGLINLFLGWFGVDPINWVNTGATWGNAMISLIIYIVWLDLAFKILVFLSGLQGIDKQYYDAARVDSASRQRIFRRITVPLLSPMIMYITVTSFIGAFKAYTQVIGMFGQRLGPPGNDKSLITIVALVYEGIDNAANPGALSEAAATALVLFAVTLVFTLVNFQVSKKRVHY